VPPLALVQPPSIPPISTLVTSIIASSDRLCFISHSLGNPSVCEWRLVCIAFSDSTALSPSCLQDERFLVEFYTFHHDDVRFNAINQQYWLQYHSLGNLTNPTSTTTTHLICPSDTLEALAMKQKLVPFCCWLNLTHLDTIIYIHHSILQLSMDGKHATVFLSMTGTSCLARLCSFRTSYLGLTYHPILSTWIAAFTLQSVTHRTLLLYAPCGIWILIVYTIDKRSLVYSVYYPPLHFGATKRELSGYARMLAATSQTHRVKLCSNKNQQSQFVITTCSHQHLWSCLPRDSASDSDILVNY
jgi:hypothetical protein